MLSRSLSSALIVAALSSTMLATAVFASSPSGWTTTKVADGAAGAYCAVSRKIDDVTVTVGRSVAGASSLALEFQNGQLNPQKTYRISLKPGSAERMDVDAQPISPSVFVLNLDQVVDLQDSFAASPTLQMRYDDQSMALALSNWDGASKDLSSCLSSLKPDAAKVAAAAPPKTKDPAPKKTAKPVDAEKQPVKMTAVDDGRLGELQQQNFTLQDENKRLAETLRTLRQDLENVQQRSSGAPLVELQEKIKWLESQNQELRMNAPAAPVRDVVAEKQMDDLRASVAVLEAENARLKSTAVTASTTSAKPGSDAFKDMAAKLTIVEGENLKLKAAAKGAGDVSDRFAALETENKALKTNVDQMTRDKVLLETQLATARAAANVASGQSSEQSLLKAKLELAEKNNAELSAKVEQLTRANTEQLAKAATPAVDPRLTVKIDDLTAQVDQLNAQNATLRSQVAANAEQPKTPDMAELQQRNESLAAENVKLRGQVASFTPVNDMKVSVAAEMPLRQQLRSLRGDNAALQAQVDELKKQLDSQMSGSDKELLTASKKNWDLEQATRRSQEAEREVKRLSLTLREDRAKCMAEKKEIEYMLFDPKLAKEGQIALLNSLEDELAAVRAGRAPVTRSVAAALPRSGTSVLDDLAATPSRDVAIEQLSTAAADDAPAAVPVASSAAPVTGQSLGSLLKRAGVQLSQAIAPAARNPFGGGKAWTWETGALAGMSVEQPAVQPASFDTTVSKQLGNLKSFCKGDFAAQPAGSSSVAGMSYAAYDAACIAGANSTSAAILFYQKGGAFNVISHEAAPDDMDKAMDVRDRILDSIGG